jgi:hypothetical protein
MILMRRINPLCRAVPVLLLREDRAPAKSMRERLGGSPVLPGEYAS